jgi:LiaI-LiaF-like transmembrane region
MQINRGLVFWGVALVTAGVVALAVQQGYVDRDALIGAWRLWPVVLIAIGLAIIVSRTPFALLGTIVAGLVVGAGAGVLISVGPGLATCGGPEPTSTSEQDGAFSGSEASVDLDFSCGTLDVGLTDGSGWSVAIGQTGGGATAIGATETSLAVTSQERGFMDGEEHWEISLGAQPTYSLTIGANAATSTLELAGGSFTDLSVNPNAGSLTLDLQGTAVEALDLSMNAGSTAILVDETTELEGTLATNAGSFELCAAPGTALRITVQANLTFSHDLEDSDLVQNGNTWTSAGFEDADHHVDLHLEGNAASFSLNPEEGCT